MKTLPTAFAILRLECFRFFAVAALLAGCATTPLPPFPPTHPASPEAQEASTPPARLSLSADEATRTTSDLLKGAEPPTAPSDSMQNMPAMHH